jgi:hypothetical protein
MPAKFSSCHRILPWKAAEAIDHYDYPRFGRQALVDSDQRWRRSGCARTSPDQARFLPPGARSERLVNHRR